MVGISIKKKKKKKKKCFNISSRNSSGQVELKSRIVSNEESSVFFPCLQGVRQGENLSPFLFSLFLNDLNAYLTTKRAYGVTCDINYEDISYFMKILVILFADDTVIFGTTEADLQYSLDLFQNYCEHKKLTVNVSKTKIVIFSNSKMHKDVQFKFQSKPIEIVDEYKYLGILFTKNGLFTLAKEHIAEQANKAMFALLNRINDLDLPYDLQLDVFNRTVKPILLYGSEIWGFGNCKIIERVHLRFIKYIFKLKKSTPSHMIYGELGIFPIITEIQARIISFWGKLIENSPTPKLSSALYNIIYYMHDHKQLKSQWLDNVKSLLCTYGYSGVWYSQSFINAIWLNRSFTQKLKDSYIQEWYSKIDTSSGSNNYRLFKTKFETSSYINCMSKYFCRRFLSFRTRNHRFPVEVGRWYNTRINERKCHLCNNDLGDEYHYLLICPEFESERKKYLKPYYYKRPNVVKYSEIMNTNNEKMLKQLCLFIDFLLKTVC